MKNKTTFSIHRGLIAFFFGILFCFAPLSGQNVQDTIIAYFNLLEKIPQEKLYLHLDKPFYGAGEKIWFKGYLVNSVTHQDNTQSNFIITELVNRSEAGRMMRDSVISGFIVIPYNFEALLVGGQGKAAVAPIQVIVSGGEPNTANFIRGYSQGVIANWQQTRTDRKSTRLNSSHKHRSRMPSSA